jgi:Sec-independent protein secretion pathway component TatC
MNTLLIPLNNLQGKTAGIALALVAIFWAFRERSPAMLLSACMLAVCVQLPLITSFGLYFLGQHSVNGWSHLKQGLKTNNTALFMKAIPFTAGAFLLFAVMLYCLEREWLNAFKGHWITAFFVFISCISFPHVISMHQFYKKSFN